MEKKIFFYNPKQSQLRRSRYKVPTIEKFYFVETVIETANKM